MTGDMKKYIVFFFAVLLAVSCDYLDKQPDDMKTDEMVWTNQNEVLKYLSSCYACLPSDKLHQDSPWLGCSDECDIVWYVYPTYGINQGNWEPSTDFYNKWATYYRGIRSTLSFEHNIDRCEKLDDALKKRYIGESKFLRGFYYFLLVRQYGPVVLIKDFLSNSTDYSNMQRDTFEECIAYICQMMDEAAELLPDSYVSNPSNYGRATTVACHTVKAEALLLAASPLWNGNPAYASFVNKDGTNLAPITYDAEKWQRAADAAKVVILQSEDPAVNLGLYGGEDNEMSVGSANYNPYLAYYDLFNNGWNKEIIMGTIDFGRPDYTYNGEVRYGWMIHCNPTNGKAAAGMGGVGPTLRLIDAFYMENGYGIEDMASGYQEDGFAASDGPHITVTEANQSTEKGRVQLIDDLKALKAWGHMKGDRNMFANREPRFYASINYQHRIPLTVSSDALSRNQWSSDGHKDGYGRLECYYGGTANSETNNYSYSSTGFYPQKMMIPCDFNVDNVIPGKYVGIYFRYAQVLLDYIEALNEVSPGNSDIRKYWDQIHERAGIPSIFDTHPEIAGNKDAQREYILRERQIELCLEGDRYFTTRRRLLSGTPDTGATPDTRKYGDGGRVWGLSTFGGADVSYKTDTEGNMIKNDWDSEIFYTRRAIEERVWKDCYYLFPIPQKEIDKSPGLVQNPGWETTVTTPSE